MKIPNNYRYQTIVIIKNISDSKTYRSSNRNELWKYKNEFLIFLKYLNLKKNSLAKTRK